MVMYAKIRRMYYREHLSINEIQRRTNLSRNTIKKWLQAPSDSTVKRQMAKKPGKLTPFESGLMFSAGSECPSSQERTPHGIAVVQRNIERRLCRRLYDYLRLYPQLAQSRKPEHGICAAEVYVG